MTQKVSNLVLVQSSVSVALRETNQKILRRRLSGVDDVGGDGEYA